MVHTVQYKLNARARKHDTQKSFGSKPVQDEKFWFKAIKFWFTPDYSNEGSDSLDCHLSNINIK